MAQLSFTFDTGSVSTSRIIDAICTDAGYSATLPNGQPNPETKAQCAKRIVKDYIVMIVKKQEDRVLAETATNNNPPINLT